MSLCLYTCKLYSSSGRIIHLEPDFFKLDQLRDTQPDELAWFVFMSGIKTVRGRATALLKLVLKRLDKICQERKLETRNIEYFNIPSNSKIYVFYFLFLQCESKNREHFDLTSTIQLCDDQSDKRSKLQATKHSTITACGTFMLRLISFFLPTQ